ncbi:MAG TPA: Gfo/Idh/MocA family oxidoreductase [Clostridia bacterium]|nr:Gfo/Idh/MocA family oxidoreductase [Clostridia bacterium]
MNIAFAGFRHGHIFALLEWARQANLNIVAAFENDEDAIEAAESKGISITHNSYDKMLEDKSIDIIAIGNYYSIRGEMAIKALNAGKHVISDKPLCTSIEELNMIAKTATEKNKKVGCMLDLRYAAATLIAKKIVSSGKLGEIHNVSFGGQHCLNVDSRPHWYFEEGKHGGTINDLAIHGIDLVRYITGKSLSKVNSARCWNAYSKKFPNFKDSAQFMAEFENSTGLIADVSYALPNVKGFTPKQWWRFTFWGENGLMEFNYNDNTVELILNGADKTQVIEGESSKSNPLLDFIAEINGEKRDLNTKSVLESSMDTLLIQAAADKT